MLLLIGAYYIVYVEEALGAVASSTSSAEAETPYGESLSIELTSGSSTSEATWITGNQLASWLASYSDSDSQDVYTVNSTYKSQEQVSLSYSASVSHSSVSDIEITVKIKAIDKADSSYYEYTLASSKSLSGTSPISDNGSTTPSISTHLSSIVASSTDATISYQIYAQVTATGTVSGQTLTAEVPYTRFGCLHYEQSSEEAGASVTPIVEVTSWVDDTLGLPDGSAEWIAATLCVVSTVWYWRKTTP